MKVVVISDFESRNYLYTALILKDTERIKWSVFELNNVDYDKYVEELTKAVTKLEQL